jgi:hypothetical protein
MPFSKDPSAIGSKLGPRLADLISRAIITTKRGLLHTEHTARVTSMQEIIDRAGREVADLYRPVIRRLLDEQPDMPAEIREHLEKAASGAHQWQAIAGFVAGSGAGSSLSTLLSNYLAPGVRALVNLGPQLTPSNETMAALGAKGTWPLSDVHQFSRGQGYSDDIITAEIEANKSYPDLTTTIELLRRHKISRAQAGLFLHRNGIPPELHDTVLALQEVPLSPADLADMVVRGIVTEGEGRTVAAESGVNAQDFGRLILDTGEPLGLQQMLEAFRRGFIDEAKLVHGIRTSRIRDEWIPTALKLRYTPMSVADAVNAVVQNHIPASRGEQIAQLNGLEPGQFGILQETAGEPLSRTEMNDLYNRGEATHADVQQALRESRLKDKYIEKAFALRRRIIPARTLHVALTSGAVSHEEAVKIAMEDGYTEHDARIVVDAGSSSALTSFKAKTVQAIETLYEDNLLPEHEAQGMIEGQGYSAQQASYILKAAEFRRMARVVTSVVSQVRSRYLGHHITKQTATGLLDTAGIPATQRDSLINLWSAERAAFTRTLTEAQIVKAHKLKLLSDQQAIGRLTGMGYNAVDADLLLKGA